MKKSILGTCLLLIILIVKNDVANAQFANTNIIPDSLFPVINRFNEGYSAISNTILTTQASVNAIRRYTGKYLIQGNFTNLAVNNGPALVLDSSTLVIKTPQKWKINGTVHTSIPDGSGGFYIGGNFTKIGSVTRNFLAQINSQGQPTDWNPNANAAVNKIFKRNDTLFIAGDFTQLGGLPNYSFALYSLSGNKPLTLYNAYNFDFTSIYNFIVQGDTVLFTGQSGQGGVVNVQKCSFKANVKVPWNLQYGEYNDVKLFDISADSNIIIYSDGRQVHAVDNHTGKILYSISASVGIYGLKVNGNKAYVVGNFTQVLNTNNQYLNRPNFFAFDVKTGQILGDTLNVNGYVNFLDIQYGKLIISGKFTNINGISRENFVSIDTANYQRIDSVKISPTDPLTTIAFSKGSMFIGGYFTGINSTHRNNLAIVDSATGTILPSGNLNANFVGYKSFAVKGDSLFILGVLSQDFDCIPNDYSAQFAVYSISTGQELNTPFHLGNQGNNSMNYFTLDENYFYATINGLIRRYNLPDFSLDPSWGWPAQYALQDNIPSGIFVSNSEIFAVGDNRFASACSNPTSMFLDVYSKATGYLLKSYYYQGSDGEAFIFDKGLLYGGKIYVQGNFTDLNGVNRNSFAALDTVGDITSWNPTFIQPNALSYTQTSRLMPYKNGIWFASFWGISSDSAGKNGFQGIDTSSANPITSLVSINEPDYNNTTLDNYDLSRTIFDFLLDENELVVGGIFNNVNGFEESGVARFKNFAILPELLSSFTGQLKDNNALLSWQSANDADVDHFNIQRSYNGVNFSAIGSIQALRNNIDNYAYSDINPFSQINKDAYYRLQIVGKGGNIYYSKIVLLKIDGSENVYLYPNPASNLLHIEGLPVNKLSNIIIYNGQGQVVKSVEIENSGTINIGNFPKGVYLLKTDTHTFKFIKY